MKETNQTMKLLRTLALAPIIAATVAMAPEAQAQVASIFTQRELNAINDACYKEVSDKFPADTIGYHFGECVKYVQTRWMEQKLLGV